MPIRIPQAKKKELDEDAPRRSSKKIPFRSPKGMHDTLPDDFLYLEKIRKVLEKVSSFYGFDRIDTPVLEDIRLFERGTGMTSEVVEKQMFVVKGKHSGSSLALRPEMTPGVLRAYVQSGMNHTRIPGKFFYLSSLFRHEQPQAGRFRQFRQVGFEILNATDPAYDAQVVFASYKILSELRLKDVVVRINSIGCKTCRASYVKKLKEYYRRKATKLCRDCQKRYKDNPLRLLDCKNEKCQPYKQDAPISVDALCSACKKHFTSVLEFLDDAKIPYLVDHFLVRGLDYYSRTVFELFVDGLGFALGGGGRYDYLSEMLSGPKMGATGSALGVERIIEAMKHFEIVPAKQKQARVFMVHMGEEAKRKAFCLLELFYREGIVVRESFSRDSLKSQLRLADKEEVDIALILGQREVFEEVVIVRDMKTGNQETVPLSRATAVVKKKLKGKK